MNSPLFQKIKKDFQIRSLPSSGEGKFYVHGISKNGYELSQIISQLVVLAG